MGNLKDDRIFPSTRIVAAVVIPILVLAFIILYFFPAQSGERFAWKVEPNMTAMFIAAGYLGGSWVFVNALFGRRWHRVAPGFLPITTFTVAMLAATVLYWSRFDINHFPFQLWLILYIVTPFLIPWLWLRNRSADSGDPEPGDRIVPPYARWSLRVLGILLLAFGILGFVAPNWIIQLWPWKLTLLSACLFGGWFALLGVGGLIISGERRWSGWRVGLQSIGLWHVLVIVAAILNPGDFPGGLFNWYVISVVIVLAGMAALYARMELQPAQPGK